MFQTTWAGDCSAWQCDELGHLNMSYYFDKFEQARMGLFIRMGLVNAFTPKAHSTVRSRDIHIKYLAEARPGQPLRVESAVLALHETTARVAHIMYHLDGRIAATLNEVVEHIYLRTDKAFAWPSRLRSQIDAFTDQLPAPAKPRNVDLEADIPDRDRDTLVRAGADDVAGGVFLPVDAMPAGHIPFSKIFRRVTTTMGWFQSGWPEFKDPAYMAAGGSAVVLEIRLHMHRFVAVGTAYSLVPAMVGADGYIRTIMHNIVNAADGSMIASGYAAGGLFDLNERKLIKPSPERLSALTQLAAPELAPA